MPRQELVALMQGATGGPKAEPGQRRPHLAPKGQVTGVMMVGLQGSGKTTTTAKLARLLKKQGHRPLRVAADMQRPAAVEQLKVLGEQVGVPVFNVAGASPLDICKQALAHARGNGDHDIVVYDTKPAASHDRRGAHARARRDQGRRGAPGNISATR